MKDADRQKWLTAYLFAPLALVIVFMMMVVASMCAQTATTGDIAGIVTDQTSAVVAGVSVTLKNVDTGGSTSAITNAQGSFNVSMLQPGRYSISAKAAGFQGIAKTVTVALGSSTTATLQL